MTFSDDVQPTRLAGFRVLVVEDEMLLAVELIDELQELGAIPIGPIASLPEALAAIENTAIDLAMLNVHLRGQLSFPAAKALVARNIPFVFVTGNDTFVRQHFPQVPAHQKPYEMAQIVDALERLMKEAAARRPAGPAEQQDPDRT
ncbi:response regulator [Lichenihabitans psoromatis]|uniref:response regulator n=1 Tax=Lichenihabitans psoromatis TaxID=2528642 RepID=UPI001036BF3C|nr:response regulator [Lichenihabitans psoromatis]